MQWTKLDAKWDAIKDKQPGDEIEAGVTYTVENWDVPGEDPLPVRVCTRKGFPLASYTNAIELKATSITLHITAGYCNFSGLMGGNDPAKPSKVSVHFIAGRDGNAYLLVPIERVAWHANAWSTGSVGIEVDNIGPLKEKGDSMYDSYGGLYCAKSETNVFNECTFLGVKNWATWTDAQYDCVARLIKAICHKGQIPRYIQPDSDLFKPLTTYPAEQLKKFRGVMTHYQVNPNNRADIGPYIDWARLIHSAGLTQGDVFNTPDYTDEMGTAPADSASGDAAAGDSAAGDSAAGETTAAGDSATGTTSAGSDSGGDSSAADSSSN